MLLSSTASASMVRIAGGTPHPKYANEPIRPLPQKVDLDPRLVQLGRSLFIDSRLSADNTLACSSCHLLDQAGVDNRKVSIGINGATGFVNAPSVYNSGLSFVQFWDGRAASLEEQVTFPLTTEHEMGSNWKLVISRLEKDKAYQKSFAEIFPQGITQETISKAIATFERSLITPNSRFDRFLMGEETAITEQEKHGYQLFKSYGCSSCHQGVAVGGNLYQKMGVMRDYFKDRGGETKADLGRYNVTGKQEHKHMFKVPSLRNVALTAPYFHDGSAATLTVAVNTMAIYQLGRALNQQHLDAIVAFLKTLTGDIRP